MAITCFCVGANKMGACGNGGANGSFMDVHKPVNLYLVKECDYFSGSPTS